MTPLTELVDEPGRGRVYGHRLLPGLADVTPTGRVRTDALARWLQDVAYADVADAGVADRGAWVVRRCRLRVERFPRFAEPVALRTFCTGVGPRWAERRTSIAGDAGARVEAAALWIFLDGETRTPARLDQAFLDIYGSAVGGRRVRVRRRHPDPAPDAPRAPWRFRATDLDLAGHVNNAAYWALLEERLIGGPDGEPATLDAEAEFRTGAGLDPLAVARGDGALWVLDGEGEVSASILLAPAP